MNNIDKQYQILLQTILEYGIEKKDRTGTGTKSIFGYTIRHKMSDGFPLLTTKKMHWNSIATELLWFLRGDTNIKFLLDYDCHIWDGDAYKNYTNKFLGYEDIPSKEWFINEIKNNNKFAEKFGELGPIYGKQWRNWNGINQITNLISELKTNPDSRRLMVGAWNVGELDQMILPPCHYGFQIYTRELSIDERVAEYEKRGYIKNIDPLDYAPKRAISLMWNQRSVDTFLGLPFNIASYALLLEIIAREVNMVPEELIGNLGDTHLYLNHIEQAKEQISRTSYELPTIQITERNWYMHEVVKQHMGEKTFDDKIMSYRPDCFELIGYQSHPKIKAPLSN
jgi:thymidylate synthase